MVVVLLVEAQGDAVAVAAGGLAGLGDAGAEAGHTAALRAEVAVRTVPFVHTVFGLDVFHNMSHVAVA